MPTILFVAAMAMFATANADEDETPKTQAEVEQVFESLDRNNDERISQREASRKPSLRERFAGVDESGDGYLSRSEYRSRPSDERFE
jgi:Ca2+-binding EF-hand superfamily protein